MSSSIVHSSEVLGLVLASLAHKLGKLASEFYYLPVGATFIFSPLNMMFLFVLSVSAPLSLSLSLSLSVFLFQS